VTIAPVVPTRRAPLTYDSDGQTVFGVIHRPAAEPGGPRPGVVILHGLVGSKDQPHRLYVTLAEGLARAGVVALRVDFRGRGDSEGLTIDITPGADVADARRAVDALAAQPDVDAGRLGLVGHSWGGAVAAVLAGRDPRIGAVVLWNAAAEPHGWAPPMEEFDGRQAFEVFGNLVGKQFYDGVRTFFPLREIAGARGPVLVVQSTADEATPEPVAAAERLGGILAGAGVPHELVLLEGVDHAFMRHRWERAVVERTAAWLGRTLSAAEPGASATPHPGRPRTDRDG
jgi:uncharacterized protein